MSSDSEDAYDDYTPQPGMHFQWRIRHAFQSLYLTTKNVLSPSFKETTETALQPEQTVSAPHPGAENVSYEEALKRCPHLAQQHQQQTDQTCPPGATSNASRCPYQNDESQEWPMRAVLMFIAYNVISVGVNVEIVKIGFVIGAYHIGLLRISEFVVIYMATAAMSSYKLLGLMLMLTNKGGPVLSLSKQYSVTAKNLLSGLLLSIVTVILTGLAMHWAKYMEYFKKEEQSAFIIFSPINDLFLPLASEFVFRGFLLKEMGRDLGAWFGVIGSSGWFGILHRGQGSVKFAAFVHGVIWSICTSVFGGDLVPATVAHLCVAILRAIYPSLYFWFYPDQL